MEKKTGCMSGFLQIFDRHQRIYSTKRLPPAMDSSSESERKSPSPNRKPKQTRSEPSPAHEIWSPAENPTKSPIAISAFEFKEGSRSSMKFSREAPRLSLDSRAIVDANGRLCARENCVDRDEQRRSTSVVAKLMGLEVEPLELRRSASESRIANFQENPEIASRIATKIAGNERRVNCAKSVDSRSVSAKSMTTRRKSFFDSQEVFTEPKQSVSIYNEIERRLKLRGIDDPSKDLETLKQILDALQLKGLLHSGKASNRYSNPINFVPDRRFSGDHASPIMLPRPEKSPDSPTPSFRSRTGDRRNPIQATKTAGSRRNPNEIDRSLRNHAVDRRTISATGNGTSIKSSQRRRPPTTNESPEQRRASLSPMNSPKPTMNRSLKNRKPAGKVRREEVNVSAEDEYSSISGSSISTPSQTDTERPKDGRILLEIAPTELRPSPVSLSDSSSYNETSSFASPVKEQSIQCEDEIYSPAISFHGDNSDSDFAYISEIFIVSSHSSEDSDHFLVLEQQFLNASKASRVHRRLIFDTVGEILDRRILSPPWKAISLENPGLERTWSEFRKIRERDTCGGDLFEVICGVLRKDVAGDAISGWSDFPIGMSEAVLDIERLIFKDLIEETIRDLAVLGVDGYDWPRRKLVF